jgi:hypothetical protein
MPRFYIGHTVDDKELWKASNVTAEGNILITVELSFAGQDSKPLERYKAALVALGRDATQRRQLSKYCWLFKLDTRLNDVFQTLVNHLGVEHHSYSAADLDKGEGLAYDVEKRVVGEFYAKNWMA